MSNDVKFEGKERRLAGIVACMNEYGISTCILTRLCDRNDVRYIRAQLHQKRFLRHLAHSCRYLSRSLGVSAKAHTATMDIGTAYIDL